MAKALQLKD